MSRFNLIDEKWIPVRFLNGNREELGIQDTLLRAKEIAAIEDPSPLVVASLHRFLLAVLYRALEGPTDIDQAKKCFRDGLPREKIRAYLEKWRDRFWLFDDKYPFGQVPGFKPKEWKAWSKLAAEHNADNAKVLFDHLDVTNPMPISLPAGTRWLLAAHTFDLAVAKSEFAQPLDAPSARSVFFIVLGATLHETLCLCLKPQANHITQGDSALWEKTPESVEVLRAGPKKSISGYADLYSWRSRSIALHDLGGDTISTLGFASGISKASDVVFIDPMLCYQESQTLGLTPLKFREDKDLWRYFDSVLPGGGNKIPLVLENAILLCRYDKARWPIGVLVCGQKTKSGQAKVDFWRNTLFVLPRALSSEVDVRSSVQSILAVTEDSGSELRSALWTFYRFILVRRQKEKGSSLRKEEVLQIGKMADVAMPLHLYWSTLESRFLELLSAYTIDCDVDEIRRQWLILIRDAVAQSWEQHRSSVSTGDAWAIRALVKADGIIRAKLKELDEEILRFTPAMEEA
ncbi:MAG: type I-E CRISPR-associated protein Cse1/CasA [Nitrospira sp.]|nr:type I-E CRISPR-associated protein Cse1/CasA [Nitrospira sp.]